ncbi:hypothetical protein HZS_2522 [Henneguya salminicola]|nr:hypothetical protein HZS_2522 [Henneguya salminicola]
MAYLERHYQPQKPLMVRRMEFYGRKRQPLEGVEQYLFSLKTAAALCEFGNTPEERIRDQLIIGISDERYQQELVKLCCDNTTRLADVVKLALFLEATSSNKENRVEVFKINQKEHKNINGTRTTINKETTCMNCGNKRHRTTTDGHASNVNCYYCKKKGHFSSVCY